jgi:hypothetical protein
VQSEFAAHMCSVSVTVCAALPHVREMFEMHVGTHCDVREATVQFGTEPPARTAVPQHSGVEPVH